MTDYSKLTAEWSEELREEFEERAAIMEYDGGLLRDEAEQKAYERLCEKYNIKETP